MKNILKLLLQIVIFIGLKIKEYFCSDFMKVLVAPAAAIVLTLFIVGKLICLLVPEYRILRIMFESRVQVLSHSIPETIFIGLIAVLHLIFVLATIVIIIGLLYVIVVKLKESTTKDMRWSFTYCLTKFKNFIIANWKQSKEITDRIIK